MPLCVETMPDSRVEVHDVGVYVRLKLHRTGPLYRLFGGIRDERKIRTAWILSTGMDLDSIHGTT